MAIFQLLYVSGATRKITAADIDDILAKSRANNAGLDVTGVLLVAEDTFIQVLEGDRATVQKLAGRIKTDSRHRNFMVLFEHDTDSRAFSQWQMGFKRLDPARGSDQSVFRFTRAALESRVSKEDGGLMLDAILAFAGQDFLAEAV